MPHRSPPSRQLELSRQQHAARRLIPSRLRLGPYIAGVVFYFQEYHSSALSCVFFNHSCLGMFALPLRTTFSYLAIGLGTTVTTRPRLARSVLVFNFLPWLLPRTLCAMPCNLTRSSPFHSRAIVASSRSICPYGLGHAIGPTSARYGLRRHIQSQSRSSSSYVAILRSHAFTKRCKNDREGSIWSHCR